MRGPEKTEPALSALGALCTRLETIPTRMWLQLFLDMIDKARRASPSEELIFLLRAAYAKAPKAEREVALNVLRDFETSLRRELRAGRPIPRTQRNLREILLVVPKEPERLACVAAFDCADVAHELFDSHIRYQRFQLATGTDATVTLVCMQREGNLNAAHIVYDYVAAFGRPDLAILCGMAMGTESPSARKMKVKRGDVVAAEAVWDTGPRRITHENEHTRPAIFNVPTQLEEDLRHHTSTGADGTLEIFDGAIDRTEAGLLPDEVADKSFRPGFRPGVVLSGDELVEDQSGPERAHVHDRAYVLEMEGAGFASTCDRLRLDWAVVRGVADHGEPNRPKDWQVPATLVAASFVRSFLEDSWVPSSRTTVAGKRD